MKRKASGSTKSACSPYWYPIGYMKTRMILIIGVLLLAGCLTAPTCGVQTIPASDKCFRYEGRFDLPTLIRRLSSGRQAG